MYCCNLSIGIVLNVWFTMNGMCAKNNTHIYVARTRSSNRVILSGDLYCCFLPQCEALRTCHSGFLIATKWCCHLWQGCEGRAKCSLHKKNVQSVRLVVKRRGCCCNLSVSIVLNVWFTTNGMCTKNNTHIYMARTSSKSDLVGWSPLLFAATVWSFVHMPLWLSDCNSIINPHEWWIIRRS